MIKSIFKTKGTAKRKKTECKHMKNYHATLTKYHNYGMCIVHLNQINSPENGGGESPQPITPVPDATQPTMLLVTNHLPLCLYVSLPPSDFLHISLPYISLSLTHSLSFSLSLFSFFPFCKNSDGGFAVPGHPAASRPRPEPHGGQQATKSGVN